MTTESYLAQRLNSLVAQQKKSDSLNKWFRYAEVKFESWSEQYGSLPKLPEVK